MFLHKSNALFHRTASQMLEEHYVPLITIQCMLYSVVSMNAFKKFYAWKPHWMKLRCITGGNIVQHFRHRQKRHWNNSFHFPEGGNDPKQNIHCRFTILSFNLYPSRLIFQVGWGLASAKKLLYLTDPKKWPWNTVILEEGGLGSLSEMHHFCTKLF